MKMGSNLVVAVVCLCLALFCVSSEKANTEDYLSDWNVREDWSKFQARFPYDLSTVMKEGRSVLYIPFGKWIGLPAKDKNKMFSRYVARKMMGDAFNKSLSMSGGGSDSAVAGADFDVFLNLEAAMGYENIREEFQTLQELLGVNAKYSSRVYGFSLINFGGITFNLSSWPVPPRHVIVLADRCDEDKKRRILLDYFGEGEENLPEEVKQSCWGTTPTPTNNINNDHVEHEKHQEL